MEWNVDNCLRLNVDIVEDVIMGMTFTDILSFYHHQMLLFVFCKAHLKSPVR